MSVLVTKLFGILMTIKVHIQVLDRLGEIPATDLRKAIHKLLTEHEQMRRRLAQQRDAGYVRDLNTQTGPGMVRRRGPYGAILDD